MTAPPTLTLRDLAISAAGRAITTGTSLDIARGETIAIVGESGSGKSLTAKAIARLLPPGVLATGRVTYDGIDLLALPEREMQQIRGRRLSLMLQDPFTMLNPLMKSGLHIAEMLRDRPEFRDRAAKNVEISAHPPGNDGYRRKEHEKTGDAFEQPPFLSGPAFHSPPRF